MKVNINNLIRKEGGYMINLYGLAAGLLFWLTEHVFFSKPKKFNTKTFRGRIWL